MSSASQDYHRIELVWPGKRTEVERVRLPFQVIERVNDVRRAREGQAPMLTGATALPDWWPENWRNKLIWVTTSTSWRHFSRTSRARWTSSISTPV